MLSMHARHDLILRRRAQGWHVTRIAAEVGMSRRGVEAVLERSLPLRMPGTQPTDVDELLLLIADGYQQDLDDLGDLITEDSTQTQKLRAIRARMEVRGRYLEMLAEFGLTSRAGT